MTTAEPLASPAGGRHARPGRAPVTAAPAAQASGAGPTISVRGLRMSYGTYEAVRGIDLGGGVW
jgi:hypothetical protein